MLNLTLSPLIYPLAAGFLLSVAIAILLAVKKPFKKYSIGIMLFIMCAVWIFFYILELISPDIKFKILWSKMQYLGISTAPVTLFILILYFSGYLEWANFKRNSLYSPCDYFSYSIHQRVPWIALEADRTCAGGQVFFS
jgi:hypothetical protein